MKQKTPEQIAAENEEVTRTSLEMMEELLAVSHEQLEVLKDMAAMLQEGLEEEEEN